MGPRHALLHPAITIALLVLVACQSTGDSPGDATEGGGGCGSQAGAEVDATADVAYKPPLMPIRFVVDSDRGITATLNGSFATPIGTFEVGGGVERSLEDDSFELAFVDAGRDVETIYCVRSETSLQFTITTLSGEVSGSVEDQRVTLDVSDATSVTINSRPGSDIGVAIPDLAEGDCLSSTPESDGATAESFVTTSCDLPHAAQIFHVNREAELEDDLAIEHCGQVARSELSFSADVHTWWNAPGIVCMAKNRFSDSILGLQVDDCFSFRDDEGWSDHNGYVLVDCERPHAGEVFALEPSLDLDEEDASQYCRDRYPYSFKASFRSWSDGTFTACALGQPYVSAPELGVGDCVTLRHGEAWAESTAYQLVDCDGDGVSGYVFSSDATIVGDRSGSARFCEQSADQIYGHSVRFVYWTSVPGTLCLRKHA